MNQRRADIISGTVLFGLSMIIFLQATTIEQRLPVGLDSGMFPEITSLLLGLLSIVVVSRSLIQKKAGDKPLPWIERRGILPTVLTFSLVFAYIISIDLLGFAVSTVVYLPLQFFVLSPSGERNWLAFVAVGAATTAVIYIGFVYGFRLALPDGMFI